MMTTIIKTGNGFLQERYVSFCYCFPVAPWLGKARARNLIERKKRQPDFISFNFLLDGMLHKYFHSVFSSCVKHISFRFHLYSTPFPSPQLPSWATRHIPEEFHFWLFGNHIRSQKRYFNCLGNFLWLSLLVIGQLSSNCCQPIAKQWHCFFSISFDLLTIKYGEF